MEERTAGAANVTYLWIELTDVMTFLAEVEQLRRSTNNKMTATFQMAMKFKPTVVDFTTLAAAI